MASSLRLWFADSKVAWLRGVATGVLVAAFLLLRWILLVPERYEAQLSLGLGRPAPQRSETLAQLRALAADQSHQGSADLELAVLPTGRSGEVAILCRASTPAAVSAACARLAGRAREVGLVIGGDVSSSALHRERVSIAHPWGIWLVSCSVGVLAAFLIVLRPRRARGASHFTATISAQRASAGDFSGDDAAGRAIEQVRGLRDQLYFLAAEKGLVVGVSGAPALRSGKTWLSAQLASVLAESSQVNVLLLEADFEQPGLYQLLELSMRPHAGFSQQLRQRALTGSEGPWTVIRRAPSLSVLAEGLIRVPSLLVSPEFRRAVDDLRRRYDLLVLNGPVATRGADMRAFVDTVDLMLFAVRDGVDPGKAVRWATGLLKDKRMAMVAIGSTPEAAGGR